MYFVLLIYLADFIHQHHENNQINYHSSHESFNHYINRTMSAYEQDGRYSQFEIINLDLLKAYYIIA